MGKPEVEIIFDGEDPLLVYKTDLELKMERIEELNKEIGSWKSFIIGFLFSTLIYTIFYLYLFMR